MVWAHDCTGVGGRECQQNIGEKTSLKTSTWKTEKEIRITLTYIPGRWALEVGGRQNSVLDMTAAYATSVLFLSSESVAWNKVI
jgi:hypothetical protein